MTAAETITIPVKRAAKRHVQRSPWAPWVAVILADWRKRWPEVFTKPEPLAIGIAAHIKAALLTDGGEPDEKSVGIVLHCWTKQGGYLHAVLRGAARRNLDGSEAGVPDEAARQFAKRVLDERLALREERKRREQEKKLAKAKAGLEPVAAS